MVNEHEIQRQVIIGHIIAAAQWHVSRDPLPMNPLERTNQFRRAGFTSNMVMRLRNADRRVARDHMSKIALCRYSRSPLQNFPASQQRRQLSAIQLTHSSKPQKIASFITIVSFNKQNSDVSYSCIFFNCHVFGRQHFLQIIEPTTIRRYSTPNIHRA